jgi:hypothetical protein
MPSSPAARSVSVRRRTRVFFRAVLLLVQLLLLFGVREHDLELVGFAVGVRVRFVGCVERDVEVVVAVVVVAGVGAGGRRCGRGLGFGLGLGGGLLRGDLRRLHRDVVVVVAVELVVEPVIVVGRHGGGFSRVPDDHSRLSPVLFSRSRTSRAGVGPLDAMSPVRV